jgi:hypothetical protein
MPVIVGLPAPVPLSDIELSFVEQEPGNLLPQNQDSINGLHRKVFCDQLANAESQIQLLFNERWPATSTQFLNYHEFQMGIPMNPPYTLQQRRALVQIQYLRGPWSDTLRNTIIEFFVGMALSPNPAPSFGTLGIPILTGIPLYSGLSGNVTQYYEVVESVGTFSYTVYYNPALGMDIVGLNRELLRVTPAGITFQILPFGNYAKTGGPRTHVKTNAAYSVTSGSGITDYSKTGGPRTHVKIGGGRANYWPKTGGPRTHIKVGGPKNIATNTPFVQSTGIGYVNNGSSFQINHTLGAGSNLAFLVFITVANGTTGGVESVVWNGGGESVQIADYVDFDSTTGFGREVSVWVQTAPAPGAGYFTVTLNGTSYASGVSVGLTNVNQSTPNRTPTYGYAGGAVGDEGTSTTTTTEGQSEDLNISGLGWKGTTGSILATPGSGQTQLEHTQTTISGDYVITQVSSQPGGTSVTDSWSWTDASQVGMEVTIAIVAPGGSTGGGGTETVKTISNLTFNSNFESTQSHPTAYDQISVANSYVGSDQAWAAEQAVASYVYFDYSDIEGYSTTDSTPWTGISYKEAAANGWFASGSPIAETAAGFPNDYLADIGNMAYIEAWTAAVIAEVKAAGNTGIFIDNIISNGPFALTGAYHSGGSGAAASWSAWKAAHVAALEYIIAQAHDNGLKVWANVLGWVSASDPYYNGSSDDLVNDVNWDNEVTPYLDVMWKEYWLVNAGNLSIEYNNQYYIANAMAMVTNAQNNGCAFVGNSYPNGDSLDPERRRYTRGVAFLLSDGIHTTGASFCADPDDSYVNDLVYDIGEPSGAMFSIGSGSSPAGSIGYGRNATNGICLVNTDDSASMTYSLPSGNVYTDQDGNSHSGSITVSPQDAMLLQLNSGSGGSGSGGGGSSSTPFSSSSAINTPVPSGVAIHPNSASIIAALFPSGYGSFLGPAPRVMYEGPEASGFTGVPTQSIQTNYDVTTGASGCDAGGTVTAPFPTAFTDIQEQVIDGVANCENWDGISMCFDTNGNCWGGYRSTPTGNSSRDGCGSSKYNATVYFLFDGLMNGLGYNAEYGFASASCIAGGNITLADIMDNIGSETSVIPHALMLLTYGCAYPNDTNTSNLLSKFGSSWYGGNAADEINWVPPAYGGANSGQISGAGGIPTGARIILNMTASEINSNAALQALSGTPTSGVQGAYMLICRTLAEYGMIYGDGTSASVGQINTTIDAVFGSSGFPWESSETSSPIGIPSSIYSNFQVIDWMDWTGTGVAGT